MRPVHEGPGERDPLLLAAGQLVRLALLVAREVDELERLADAARDLRLVDALAALEPERDVVARRRGGGTARSSGRPC